MQVNFESGSLSDEAAQTAEVLISFSTASDYQAALDSLGAENYGNTQISTLLSAYNFGDALMSCTARGDVANGQWHMVRDGQCSWMRIGGDCLDQDATSSSLGFDVTTYQIAGGAECEIAPGWHLGLAVSYENKSLSMRNAASGDGNYFQPGGVIKRRFGPAQFSAALSRSTGSFDSSRAIFVGETARGQQDLSNISARLRAEYAFEGPNWFVTPPIDLGVNHVSTDAFTETGTSGFDLNVDSSSETYVSLSPAVEYGHEMVLGNGTIVRPNLMIGLTYFLSDALPSTTARLEGVSNSGPSFTSNTLFGRTYLDFAAGVDVFATDRTTAKISAFGSLSEQTKSGGIKFKLKYTF